MNSVLAATSYVLVHVPDMVLHNGSTQTTERTVNPGSDYLKALPGHIRDYGQAVTYAPTHRPISATCRLRSWESWSCHGTTSPWTRRSAMASLARSCPETEFLLLLQICDVFDLVFLSRDFV